MLEDTYFIYQPNFYEESIVSYEALLRINNSNESPIEFIEQFEDKERFDKTVIERVISDKLSLKNQDYAHISINICVHSLESQSFVDYCEAVFTQHKGFTLELNFNQRTVDLQKIRVNMLRLKKVGVSFTLDDYGTECLNADSLLELNFDYIKLDRSLVASINDDYLAFCCLRSLYHKLNKFLGNKVILKGIENINQFNLIHSFGSVISQGYYLSYPLAITELDDSIEAHINVFENKANSTTPPIDRFIYNINIAKNSVELKKALEELKPQDPFNLLGIDYHNFDLSALNKKYHELIDGVKSPSILFTTHLINHCNCFFILRDEHGVAIYNNQKHIDYLDCDLVGMPIKEVLKRFPDYQTCLQLDQQLMNNESDILMSNETVEVEDTTTHFHTYRQKIKYFDKTFVMTFVYEDDQNTYSAIDPLTGCFTKEKLTTLDLNAYNSMVFIDLDGFKNINDEHGHQHGDLQLKEGARLMNLFLNKEDLLIRFGGDEFIICLNANDHDEIEIKMNQLRRHFEESFRAKNLYLSFSYGISDITYDIKHSLEEADKKMYISKRIRKKQALLIT